MNEDGKAKIIEFANLLRASRKYLPHRAEIIPFENYQPIAVEPASAGTGNYIEDSVKESYNVGPDGVYLVSLNEKYHPIQIYESDSFKIFGKVIGKCKGAEIPGFH